MVGALQKRQKKKCFSCGGSMHKRYDCPAKESECNFCHKTGHFAKVCQLKSKAHSSTAAPLHSPFLATVLAGATLCLKLATANAMINGTHAQCSLDSGASECLIDEAFVTQYNLQHKPSCKKVCMALTSFSVEVKGSVKATVTLHGQTYKDVRIGVVKDLCADAVLGHDFMRLHDSVIFQMGGYLDPLVVGQDRDPLVTRQDGFCCVSEALVNPPRVFQNIIPNCKLIATKSRQYSQADKRFMKEEIQNLHAEGIIEPSVSPWRAQVVVTKSKTHKRRVVIDYSLTVNRFTLLDAYPLPRIDDQINEIAQHKYFSTLDLTSAYYQIPLAMEDRPFTVFEASSKLYQYCRLGLRIEFPHFSV